VVCDGGLNKASCVSGAQAQHALVFAEGRRTTTDDEFAHDVRRTTVLAFCRRPTTKDGFLISISTSGLKRSKWWEYVLRFALGGLVTAGAGVVARKCGPSFGGLFLAFPAILAASSTLVEKHERERKEEKGMHGTCRGRHAAGADAAGAAMGSFGLIAFAVFVWKLIPNYRSWLIIAGATLVWAFVSGVIWYLWKCNFLRRMGGGGPHSSESLSK
jgi:hypothetical protein